MEATIQEKLRSTVSGNAGTVGASYFDELGLPVCSEGAQCTMDANKHGKAVKSLLGHSSALLGADSPAVIAVETSAQRITLSTGSIGKNGSVLVFENKDNM